MPTLRRAKQIPGTTDLKIAQGNGVPRAEPAMTLECLQAFASIAIKDAFLRKKQIREPLLDGTPHASAQLVKLCQPKAVGAIDKHGVRPRDVDTALHNRGAQ